MKILLVPASDWLGHPLTSRLHFIFERIAEHHEVHVIGYSIPLWNGKRRTKTIVHKIRGVPFRDLSLYYIINFPWHLLQLDEILNSQKFDVIVFANILAGTEAVLLSRRKGIPLVFDYLDHFPESASAYYQNPIAKNTVAEIVLKLTKWNLSHASKVVTVSTGFQDWLRSEGFQNTSIIPNGVDIQNFKPMSKNNAVELLGIAKLKSNFVVAYVGSVESWYNLEVVTDAIRILNSKGVPSLLLVVGGKLKNHDKQSTIFSSNPYVFQTGFVSHKIVPLFINASDACVLPLKNMVKNLTRPVKLLEYFSCGKPVLSLPNSEIETEFGDAITIFRNAKDLAEILLNLFHQSIDLTHKIVRGYTYASKNSWDFHAKSYESLLKDVIKGTNGDFFDDSNSTICQC